LISPKRFVSIAYKDIPLTNASMKSLLFSLVIIANVTVQTCSKKKETGIPACIQQKIDQIKSQPKWNPPAQVNEYFYNGRKVYAFSSDCCDQYNPVFDANCNYICSPSGGFSGKGDMKCSDFATSARFVKQVWRDERP
jgi:hypothetical protein